MKCELFDSGKFFVGVNYWASNAGIDMWTQWDEKVVIRDLDLLIESNIRVIRMFPLWSEFQPIKNQFAGNHSKRDISIDDMPKPHTVEAAAGIDPIMISRLDRFLDLCLERGIQVMIGLMTGWMSGKLYVPRALEHANIYTDPTALKWQQKYVKYMVNRYKDHEALVAWDIGNECNCMDVTDDPDCAYTWSALITNAIKAEDKLHPVISGMHGLNPNGVWRPQDQGEITDVLCTHPYPAFTEHCETDEVNRMKSANHAVAESLYYRGLGGKPCFAEEINTLGPMFANQKLIAANADMALFGLWAHDCNGFMWWCACNQSALNNIPYDWCALERELALINADGSHIPALDSMTDFSKFIERFGKPLPRRKADAVCILVKNQDSWGVAYGTFLLAKQAGIELEFAFHDQEIPEAEAYFMPSLSLYGEPTKHLQNELLRRVRENGATLYISMDGGMMSEFPQVTGFELVSRSVATAVKEVTFEGDTLHLRPHYEMKLKALTAEVLASDQFGQPVFGVQKIGKGKVYFCNAPIEYTAVTTPSFVDGVNHEEYHKLYRAMGIGKSKAASKCSPYIGLTEHIEDENVRYALVINYLPEIATEDIKLNGFAADSIDSVRGDATFTATADGIKVTLAPNSGAVVKLTKK
ncbi:MAG: cellulase family glycosylhydrolase [Clostridia bacterium]|nr:cellulase family glycosylhydrolase [Clostridia bacterium]